MAFNAGAIIGTAKVNNSGWKKGIKGMKSGLGVLTAAVGVASAVMVKSTKAANEWQKELNNVNTLLDTTVVNSQEMAKSLLGLDSRLGETTELTTAMYQAFSSGAEDMDEALQVTTDSAKFAKAAVTDTAVSVDVLTTAQNAYGKETVNTAQASDIFFATIKQGKLTGEQLATTIGKSIPLFASLNIPLEELGSGMAAMTKQGVNAAESTTQLNGIVNSFLKPSEDMTAALKAQGIESGSALLETEGLSGALEFLETASGGSKDTLSKLLPSVEAVRGTLALTGKGGEEFNKILGEMENSAGATDIAFKKQENVLETMQVSMGKVELVAGNIGKAFQDKMAVGATAAAEGVLSFITSSEGMEIAGNIVGTVASTFSFLKSILTPIVETVLPILGELIGTVADSAVRLTDNTTNGIGVVDIFAGVLQFATNTLTIMSKILLGTARNIVNIADVILEVGGTVSSFFAFLAGKGTWEDVKDQASNVGEAFLNVGSSYADTVVDLFKTVGSQVTSFVDETKETSKNIESSFAITFNNTKNKFISNAEEIITGQKDLTDEVIDSNEEMTTTVEDQNEDLADSTKTTFKSVGQNILNFIEALGDQWGDEYDAIISTVDTGISSIESITSLSYEKQFAELELTTRESLDAIDLFYDNRIEGLREVTAEETDISAEHRALELEELTAFANEKLEIDNEFRQADIDALTVLTDEELALEEFKRAEKIATLQASTDEQDQLELAAMLAKEAREAQLILTETAVAAERKALKDAAVEEEKQRLDDLLTTQTEIDAEREVLAEASRVAEENRLISLAAAEQDKADAIAATEAEALVESNKISKSQFETQQALQIASVWMDTASAIAGFWSVAPQLGAIPGAIFGGVMTAAMTGVGIAQSNLISQQQFIPARETGGMASGMTRINEAGGEIVTLPDGSQVIPNDISQQIATNSGNSGNIINIDFGGVSVRDESDIEAIVEEVSFRLGEELRGAV